MPLKGFTARPLDEYLDEQAKDANYPDCQLRIPNWFNVEIAIISILANGSRISIVPENSHPTGRILLGHFAEEQGDHYICLNQVNH